MVKFRFCFSFLLILFLYRNNSDAQQLPTKEIPEVVVETNKKFFSEDQTTSSFDLKPISDTPGQHIGYVLEEYSSALIRNYGAAGSLSSVSMRGTGTNHVQISWNGIPLNSPTTGQADLSLVPMAFIQNVEVINGASGTLFGSGTFGGSINLNNIPDWKNKVLVLYSANAGSFGTYGHTISLRTGNSRFQYHLSASTSKSENNFTYHDHYQYQNPLIENKHNAYKEFGFIQNFFLNLNKGNILEGGIWYQHKYLEIPAVMGSSDPSLAKQRDSLFRSFLSYRKSCTKYTFSIRSAYFSDFLNYTDKINPSDSNYLVNSRIKTNRLINDADFRFFVSSKVIVGGGFSFNRLYGNSNNYGVRISEDEYAVFGNIKVVFRNIILNGGLRKEFYEGLCPEPQYSLGVRYRFSDRLVLRSDFASKFRKPTFNEKYWRPGGNPNLKPEKGRGGEVTLEWRAMGNRSSKFTLDTKLNGFYQIVDNWIQWTMLDSLTPVEFKKVHARGIEAWALYALKAGDLSIKGHFNYNYNRSVIVSTFDDNALFKGNQLIYVPRHTYRASSEFIYKGAMLGISVLYTGARETIETGDASRRLPAFTLINLSAGYQHITRLVPWAVYLHMDNLMDKSYEMMRSYPMPGRALYFTLTVGLNKTDPQN
jgi:vitamin B12 transporter